jgi:hypothetical protein
MGTLLYESDRELRQMHHLGGYRSKLGKNEGLRSCGTQASTCKLIGSHFCRLEDKGGSASLKVPLGEREAHECASSASKKGSGTDSDGTVTDTSA